MTMLLGLSALLILGWAGYRLVKNATDYRLERVDDPDVESVVSLLLRDIQAAKRRIVLVYDRCSACDRHAEIEEGIRDAVRKNPDLQVEVVWSAGSEIPEFVTKLSGEGILELHMASGRVPLTGRIVDDDLVVLHHGRDMLRPSGYVRAMHSAPGLAESLTRAALAA